MSFFAVGIPAPQGSKRHVGHGVMVESSKAVGPWREAVAAQARQHHDGQPVTSCRVGLGFALPTPKYIRQDMARPLERQKLYPWLHTKKPDIDKLVRSTLDALVIAGVLSDDAVVHSLTATKSYVSPGGATGCHIEVRVA